MRSHPLFGALAALAFISSALGAEIDISNRLACSTLAQAKQPAARAFQVISGLGYEWLDLSCLNWARHVSVPALSQDFEKEASRVESLLRSNHLRVANLTFDAVETRPFPDYEREFTLVARFGRRVNARLINLMAPSLKADLADQIQKLRLLYKIAQSNDILLTLETHCGQITERVPAALSICGQVPGLALTLDPSHYYAGPNQGKSFDDLLPLVQGTGFRAGGMKWEQIQMPWGEGPIDFVQVVRKMEAAGYRGFYACEYIEGFNKLDAVAEARKFLEWGRRLR